MRVHNLFKGMHIRHDSIIDNENVGVISEIEPGTAGRTVRVWLMSGQPLLLDVNKDVEVLSDPTQDDAYHVSKIDTARLNAALEVRAVPEWNGEDIMSELYRRALNDDIEESAYAAYRDIMQALEARPGGLMERQVLTLIDAVGVEKYARWASRLQHERAWGKESARAQFGL